MPDMDEVKGKVKEGLGGAQEQAGRATGDRDLEAEGTARKHEGKAEGVVGKVKDAAGDAVDAVKDKVGH
jgi:uncharacterized protein YjbJ (UPF0337 family)